MQRIINFRACLILFLGAIVGVIFSLQIIQHNKTFLILTILLLFLLGAIMLSIILLKLKKFFLVVKFILAFLIGFLYLLLISIIDFSFFNLDIKNEDDAYVFSRICSISEYNNCYYTILEDCSVNGEALNGKILLVIYYSEQPSLEVGDKLIFVGDLERTLVIEDGNFDSYIYKNKIKYSSYVSVDKIAWAKGEKHFDEKVRERVKNIVFENLSYNNASICYASLFGDKTMLDYGIKSAFTISGTSHLLCVSGLHVGFVMTLVYFFLNLCKLKKKYSFWVIVILLGFYCYLCGFSPSVVRASIMSIVFAFADAYGKVRYDSLSSLGLSGVLILLTNPFYVFDLGFQLSFASCAGIIILTPVFEKFFQKIKFDNFLSQAFCVSLSAQIATFPILLHNFEKLSFVSIIANVIIVPFFSIIFMFSIVFILINLVLPFGFLFNIIEYGLNFVIFLTKGFSVANVLVFSTSIKPIIFNLLFYLGAIVISEYVNFKQKPKIFVALLTVVLTISVYLLQFYPINYVNNMIINSTSENFTLVTNNINQKVLINVGVCTDDDVSLLKVDLQNQRILNIDCLLLTSYNEEMQNNISKICNSYNISRLYVPLGISEISKENLKGRLKNTALIFTSDEQVSFNNFSFKIYSEINSILLNISREKPLSILISRSLNLNTLSVIENENLRADYFKTNRVTGYQLSKLENFGLILCYKSETIGGNIFKIPSFCDKIVLDGA